MFKKLAEKIREFRSRMEFNAENCLRWQNDLENKIEKKRIEEEKRLLNEKIEEIKGRICFVIDQSPDQHTVAFQVKKDERETYYKAKEYFINLGFRVVIITNEELDNEELMIISWKQEVW